MKLQTAAFSHTGKTRQKNDDAFCVDKDLYLFIVCDGVAQSQNGKLAADTTIKHLREYLSHHRRLLLDTARDPLPENRMELADIIQRGVESANEAVYRLGENDHTKRGSATTLDLVVVCGRYAFLAHVGDSRVYLVRDQKVRCLTEDHTVAADFLKNGQWTQEQKDTSPYRNVLSRAIGAQITVQIDLLQIELQEEDLLFLCTDGAYKHHSTMDFERAIEGTPHLDHPEGPRSLVENIIQQSLDRGGTDNLTCVGIRVENLETDEGEVSAGNKVETLEKIPLFRYLSYKEVNKVLEASQIRSFSPSSVLMQEGSVGAEFFVILKGRVQVQKGTQELIERGKGEVLGEFSILSDTPRSASVIAIEETTAICFEKNTFIAFLRKDSHIATKILWALSQELERKVRDTSRALADAKLDLEEVRDEFPFLLKTA